jgi:hypothetical protein
MLSTCTHTTRTHACMFAHNAITSHDTGHRVDCAEVVRVLGRGEHFLECDNLPLEVEHDFPLPTVALALVGEVQLVFLLGASAHHECLLLGTTKADCLASEFGVPSACKPPKPQFLRDSTHL